MVPSRTFHKRSSSFTYSFSVKYHKVYPISNIGIIIFSFDHFRITFIYFLSFAGKPSWGLENEALIARCPRQGKSQYPVDWYYSEANINIATQRGNRVFASGEHLKFLPANVNDSGIYTCIIRRYYPGGHKNPWVCSLYFFSS